MHPGSKRARSSRHISEVDPGSASTKRKAISLTYDTSNHQYAVLLDDGTMWIRKYVKHGNSIEPDGWKWVEMEIDIA